MHLKPLRDGISGSVKGEFGHIHLYSLIYRFRVYQLAVLEDGFDETGIPQGIVLATVGVDGEGQEHEVVKSIRMYNLASLTSLATYFATQTDARALELARPKDWSPQEPKRTLRKSFKPQQHHSSFTRGVKSFRASDTTNQSSLGIPPFPANAPRSPSRSPNPSASPLPRVQPQHQASTDSADSWCMLDDMPLQWASDYVPLATPNSRLAHSSVSFFELWRNDSNSSGGAAMLAIATKTSILLYETKGDRAFRFVKVCRGAQFAQSPPVCTDCSSLSHRNSTLRKLRGASASSIKQQ